MHPLIGTICRKNLLRNIKDKIILEVFKSNHPQANQKEFWRLSGYEKIIREDHENCLFDKRKISYRNQVLARMDRKLFCKKKSNGKSRCSTIHYQGDSS